jgi:hypothetical protein
MCCDLEADLSFVQLAALTANVVRWLEFKEAAPTQEREGQKGAQENGSAIPIRVLTGLPVHSERGDDLEPKRSSHDPLRDAHRSSPHEHQDEERCSDANAGNEHKERSAQHGKNVDSHLQPRPAHDVRSARHGKKIAGG